MLRLHVRVNRSHARGYKLRLHAEVTCPGYMLRLHVVRLHVEVTCTGYIGHMLRLHAEVTCSYAEVTCRLHVGCM